ncbi:MAG TPA: leucyl/phenylalanyl-tRNA--protein transferase [Kineosporiaceae bacterium]|nr:leucyl/phenylalanyl-tRNA--protein transferase [Kineosporiaceae bacterium]
MTRRAAVPGGRATGRPAAGLPAHSPVRTPVEPPPSAYVFDPRRAGPGEDLVAVGADLRAGTLLAAYRAGLFPMGLGRAGARPLGWWSPDPRGVLPLDALRVSRSLRRSLRRFEVRVDAAFDEVVVACADPARPGRWITREIAAAYAELHRLGWAHSVECWRDGELLGGLYGVVIGGLFAGESMFHRETDASKVALVGLVEILRADGDPRRLLDVQWRTDHLAGLGVVEVSRREYLARLRVALGCPAPHLCAPDAAAPG